MKVLFVDVDGTLTETISGHTFKQHPQDVKVIEGADKAIAYFAQQRWKIIGVSNQGGIAKGFKSLESTIAEMEFTLNFFPGLDCIYFCPDFEGRECYCTERQEIKQEALEFGQLFPKYQGLFRKPNPGMIKLASHTIDGKINLEECWLIGDRPEDEQCANNAGINFCPADMWRDRFRKGTFAHAATPEQIKFLEGIGVTAIG